MMKKFLFVFGLLVLFAVTVSATDYCVASAGTTAVNGTYTTYSTNDGVESFKLDTGNYYLYRYPDIPFKMWFIGATHGGAAPQTYYKQSESDTPPTGTYSRADGWGDAPAPTITEGACEPVPEFFGIHFEWFELSSGLIAAVLAIALPMTLYKRKRATN